MNSINNEFKENKTTHNRIDDLPERNTEQIIFIGIPIIFTPFI